MEEKTRDIISKVHELFRERGYTLSAAESCTGGLISHYITTLPGASTFFRGSVVSYSDEMKRTLLGISPELIRTYGVVSSETARAMAEKGRERMNTDFSISSTGNLGPGVLEDKEKGLVYVAAAGRNRTAVKELRLGRDREGNKIDAVAEALRLLVELVEKSP